MFKNQITIAIFDDNRKIDNPVNIVNVTVKTKGWYIYTDNTLDYAIYLTKDGAKLESNTYMLLYPLNGSEDALVANVKVTGDKNGRLHLIIDDLKVNIKLREPSRNKALHLFNEDKALLQNGFEKALKTAIAWIKMYQS